MPLVDAFPPDHCTVFFSCSSVTLRFLQLNCACSQRQHRRTPCVSCNGPFMCSHCAVQALLALRADRPPARQAGRQGSSCFYCPKVKRSSSFPLIRYRQASLLPVLLSFSRTFVRCLSFFRSLARLGSICCCYCTRQTDARNIRCFQTSADPTCSFCSAWQLPSFSLPP